MEINQNSSSEIHNYKIVTEHIINTIKNQFNSLLPSNITKRSKRGLINGLGSIIKTITGNLDQNDAERYDQAIEQLSKNQEDIKTLATKQISLTTQAIQKFYTTINALVHNQKEMEKRVMELSKAVEQKQLTEYILILADVTFNQLNLALGSISRILSTLENAVTFAKLNVLHPSIIEANELLTELLNIKSALTTTKLPFEPSYETIIKFEKNYSSESIFKKKNDSIYTRGSYSRSSKL